MQNSVNIDLSFEELETIRKAVPPNFDLHGRVCDIQHEFGFKEFRDISDIPPLGVLLTRLDKGIQHYRATEVGRQVKDDQQVVTVTWARVG